MRFLPLESRMNLCRNLEDPSKAFASLDPFRSSSKSSRRSRSGSPSGGKMTYQGSELLAHSLSILSSVISEDCRYQIVSPRPSRPPNSLQSVTLDVAGYLLHMHRRNPKVVSQIAFAVLPAFYTFKSEMYSKLFAFFDDVVVKNMLDSLSQAQGASTQMQGE